MNIHELETINNLTIKEFRELSREMRFFINKNKESILDIFKQNPKINPNEMFDFFVENGLLEKTKLGDWDATTALRAIAGASLQKRKTSDKAWEELAKALARTVALSDASEWSIETPSKIFLYGSMLNPNKKDYGDADLAISFGRKKSINILRKKQDEWMDTYSDFTSSKCWRLGFEDRVQMKQDIAAGSNFISIHSCDDVKFLSEEPKNIGNFPIFTLWENNELKNNEINEDTTVTLDLSKKWKHDNPEIHKEIQNFLNKALSNLGIIAYDEPDFKNSCKDYVKKNLAEEWLSKLSKLKKYGEDTKIINRMVRMGHIGFEAIGNALGNDPLFNQELSKLDYLKNIMDSEGQKHYIRGLAEVKSSKKHKSKM